ncbi:hypothetical protein JYK14_26725 [Siccirubricoccus sp. KC 17139]|uniref:Uncharacterized protein n=1 Tax=Siccirubricoccus soli TaxID=2899147 RepID=A0ABT1DDP4_9PROT|nr:hypothetical protein [Siccirubricoccus soli]MCO6419732.1 hypothetical protein [Siccirubricoccus soli]MCP2685867.1 hypothetical protein [Siccirubricoccus soli]
MPASCASPWAEKGIPFELQTEPRWDGTTATPVAADGPRPGGVIPAWPAGSAGITG